MKRPAVFIDRDGTVNEQMGYINHLSRFVIFPGTAEAFKLLNTHDYLSIIVSNQSGVARGYYPITLVEVVHDHLRKMLKKQGAFIDGIFYCPHYEKGDVPEYSIACSCRKPGTGLIDQACSQFDIDLEKSFVIGDRYSDIALAYGLKMKGILVKTGYGLGDLSHVFPRLSFKPTHVAEDLLQAVRWIVDN